MEFGILGSLRVVDAGIDLSIGGPRHRALLAALLVHPGEIVATDRLVDVLWGARPPRSAPDMVHVRVSELRRALGAGVLITRAPGYLLDVRPEQVDAGRFLASIAAGRAAAAVPDPATASARFAEALALWRGPPLADIADSLFARAEIARLEDERLQAVESRIDAELALGRHAEVVPELRSLVVEHPLRERFWSQLMTALHRSGRSGEALSAYRGLRERLIDELGVEPGPALADLHLAILRQDPPRPAPAEPARPPRTGTPHNLPRALTSFVGRRAELAEIAELLHDARLVTLVGVGGVGKTRLAVEIAAARLGDYPDGVWFVPLAPLTDPQLIPATVASAIKVNEHPDRSIPDQIVAHLRDARALLVMDNCEHLGTGPAEFAQQLLDACPSLRLLCTSRERLRITGEILRPVNGLPTTASPEAGPSPDAIELFAHRATAVRARFTLTDAVTPVVVRICQRLDGLPLAVELAAARVSSFSPAQIADGLNDRFRLLAHGTPAAVPRHRTLRAVIDWSYGLLDDAERRVFDRLSVFVGGFTFDAVSRVCGAGEDLDLIEILGSLVDKSLVTADIVSSPEYRYRQLQTVQAYAMDRLEARGEAAEVRQRHAGYFIALAAAARGGLRSAGQQSWLDRLTWEHGNLRAALRTCLARGDVEDAASVAGSIYPFWDLRGHYREGRQWLSLVLAPGAALSAHTRIRALMGAATLAVIQGDIEAAVAACTEAAELSRDDGDGAGLAHALQYLALIDTYAEQLDEAGTLLAEAVEVARRSGAQWELSWAYIMLGSLNLARGEYETAAAMGAAAERELASVGDTEAYGWAYAIRGGACWATGRTTDAAEFLASALRRFQDLGGVFGLSLCLLLAGLVLRSAGETRLSVRVLAGSEALRTSAGVFIQPFLQVWLDEALAATTAEIGEPAVRAEWAAGAGTPVDAVVAETQRAIGRAPGSST